MKLTDEEYNTFSATLMKRLRVEANMSMDELATKSHLSKSTISRYEKKGLYDIPIEKARKIADALEVPLSYLIGWESKELPSDYYHSILPLINEIGYELEYECITESFILKNENSNISISAKQLKDLKDSTYSFFKFKLSEIMNEKHNIK